LEITLAEGFFRALARPVLAFAEGDLSWEDAQSPLMPGDGGDYKEIVEK
jgi:hypothetical protein